MSNVRWEVYPARSDDICQYPGGVEYPGERMGHLPAWERRNHHNDARGHTAAIASTADEQQPIDSGESMGKDGAQDDTNRRCGARAATP